MGQGQHIEDRGGGSEVAKAAEEEAAVVVTGEDEVKVTLESISRGVGQDGDLGGFMFMIKAV